MRKSILLFSILALAPLHNLRSAAPDSAEGKPIIIGLDTGGLAAQSSSEFDSDNSGIGLALSGGGARGLAHIGILKVLEKNHIPVKFIAGVSMGGVVGGLYAAGYSPAEIEQIALSIRWSKLFSQSPVRSTLPPTRKDRSEKSILRIRFEGWRPVLPKGITSGQNLSQYLETLAARSGIRPSVSFDYLAPPLRIVCTDLSTGEPVILSSGSLAEAMRASIAVPVAFTPVDITGRLLVDGGLVDPVPVDIVRNNFSGPVIAVDASSELLPASSIDNVIDIADQTTTIMSMRKKEQSLASSDLVIKPVLSGRSSTNFSDIHAIIDAGEKAAESSIEDIKEISNRRRTGEDSSGEFAISEQKISGLESMPTTFFKSVFDNSDCLTAGEIRRNLEKAMESGYLSDCRAELIKSGSVYSLDYILRDNPRIDRIEFTGVTLFPVKQLKDSIRTRPGMIMNHSTVQSDKRTLERLYIRSGYSLVRISSDFADDTRTLVFNVDEGKINRVKIEGNRRTRDWAIRRHIPFRPGEIYMQSRAEWSVEELYGTDLFETVRLSASPDSVGVTLRVMVIEKQYKFIRSGARFDLEYGSKAFFDLVDDNLFGAGLELYGSVTVGEKRRAASLNFEADRIWNTLYTYRLMVDYGEFKRNFYQDHDYRRTFRQFQHGGELSLGRQMPRLGTIFIAGQIRRFKWDEPGKAERQSFDKGSIGIRSIVDTRDAMDFPQSGKYHIFNLEFAGDLSREKSTYTRMFTSFESYYRLSEKLNFHPSISLGVSSNFMPYFDKFSLGGMRDFPGLFEDEFLGEKLLVGELELRYRVPGPFYVAGRFSFGNVWNKLESISFNDMRISGGLGIGIKTPIGPISSWYGRTAGGLDAFYLSAGYDW